MVASSPAGLCFMGIADEETLSRRFPRATLLHAPENVKVPAEQALAAWRGEVPLPALDLSAGTVFQQKVWRALLDVPWGQICHYGDIARIIGHPKACRAVGSAVGANPIVPLIPCHRVLPSGGGVGSYGYGPEMKRRLLAAENYGL